MKTIKNLSVPQDPNAVKYPWGQIINETETSAGTPVVREIYGDILVNIYKILDDAGVVPTGTEDSEESQYQLLQAFKKFTNELNDVEQVVSLSGTVYSIPLNLDKLPDKYVMICRMADAYDSGVSYTVAGSGNNTYPMTSPTGFNASDEVIVVLDKSGARVYSLISFGGNADAGVYPIFGNPLAFNASAKMYYESEGKLLTDAPSINSLQGVIRVASGNSTLYVNEILVLQGKVLCACFDTAAITYKFFQFNLTDLTTSVEVSITGIPIGTDNSPYVYTDGTYIYISNASGTTAIDSELDKYAYNPTTAALTFSQSLDMDDSFVKSTNVVIKDGSLVSFVNGNLKKFSLTTGLPTDLGTYNTILGIIFNYRGEVYYSNGEVAKKWTV